MPWTWQAPPLRRRSNASIAVDEANAGVGPRILEKNSLLQLADIVESVWMDQYGILCSWLFLLQTAGQLWSLCTWESAGNTLLNQACNLVYASCYLSFILAYYMMQKRPGLKYMAGIFMYFIGYSLFLAICSDAASKAIQELYILGSLAFLLGSLLLAIAVCPPDRNDNLCHRLSPVRLQSSLFCGSFCFLIGSSFSLADSLGLGNASVNGTCGLAVFVVGRVYFLRGSQTTRCTVWLTQRTSKRYV